MCDRWRFNVFYASSCLCNLYIILCICAFLLLLYTSMFICLLYVFYIQNICNVICLFSLYYMSIIYNRMFMQVHVYINMFYHSNCIIIYVWCYVFLLLLDTEYALIQLRGARWSWVSWNHWTMTRLSWAKAYKERFQGNVPTKNCKGEEKLQHLALGPLPSYVKLFMFFQHFQPILSPLILRSFDIFQLHSLVFCVSFFASAFDEDLSLYTLTASPPGVVQSAPRNATELGFVEFDQIKVRN